MVRNFDNRIEVATPVFNPAIQEQLKAILDIQLKDNVKARLLYPGHINEYKQTDDPPVRSQEAIYQYFKQQISPDT